MATRQTVDIASYVEKISNLFNKVMVNSLELRVPDELCDLDLTPSQFQGLLYVLQHVECSVGELAEGLSISHPAAVKMIERLLRKKLVTKGGRSTDKRVSTICLTDCGRMVAQKVQSERVGVLENALTRMSPEEIDGLVRGLESLLEGALNDEDDIKSSCLKCGSAHIGCCVINRKHVAITGSVIGRT